VKTLKHATNFVINFLIKKLIYTLSPLYLFLIASTARAADTGPSMPWDNTLTVIEMALTGTTAHLLIVIAIAISGFSYLFGEHGSIFRKAASIVFGGAIAVGAVSLYSTLSFGGAII